YDDYGPDGLAGTSDDGLPGNRLSMTPQTAVAANAGWQTVALSEPVAVLAGQTIWLGWVFENRVAVRYDDGSPGRADSGQTWSSGPEPMPAGFGTSTQSNYIYSIYANYLPSSPASTAIKDDDSASSGEAGRVRRGPIIPGAVVRDRLEDDEELLLPLHSLY
ncbi:MAG: hypothetical protein JSW27_04465, partial [Phycisphaerales bacterium]